MQKHTNTKTNLHLKCLNVIAVLGIAVTSLVAQLMTSNSASAFSVTLTVPESIKLDVNPSSNGGFGETGNSSISVSTDSPSGYSLQLKSKGSSNDLTSSDLVGHKIAAISSTIASSSASSSFQPNTWGYKPSSFNSMPNTNYHPAPSSGASDTIAEATGSNSYDIAIAAKVDNSIGFGEYSNTYTVVATAKTVSYQVNFNVNGGSPAFSPDKGTTGGSKLKLKGSKPTKGGFTFGGWCDMDNSSDPSKCNGNTIPADGELALTQSNNVFNLYAIWTKDPSNNRYEIKYTSSQLIPDLRDQTGEIPEGRKVTLTTFNVGAVLGYTFGGWCTVNNDATCSTGQKYQMGQQIDIPQTEGIWRLTLYAMWTVKSGDEEVDDLETVPAVSSSSSTTIDCSNDIIPDSPTGIYNGATWTMARAACDWESAVNACPAGFHLPSEAELQNLLAVYGTGYGLYNAGWNEANGGESAYWSATVYTDGGDTLYSEDASGARTYASSLYVGPDYARVGYGYSYDSPVHYVRCVAN